MKTYKALIFDLDGTLSDSHKGVYNSLAYGFEKVGLPPPDLQPSDYIGPPVRQTLMGVLHDEAMTERILPFYQERYSAIGLYENDLYEGAPEMLAALRGKGYTMIIATTKPEVDAKSLLTHFDILRFFDFVAGASLDGTREAKTDVLRYGLAETKIDPATAVMIGDRHHDMEGARAIGAEAIGVLYGFGTAEELSPYQPVYLAPTLRDLQAYLGA